MSEILKYIYFILTPVVYFYFNWRYFAWINVSLDKGRMAKLPVTGAFIMNYLLFFLCSRLEFNLIVNWAVFFVFLFAETYLYCAKSLYNSAYFSLSGILSGLSVNIFCRCAVSIAISQPPADFDNHISSAGNLKGIPVILGFLLGGVLLHLMAHKNYYNKVRILLRHSEHLAFLLEIMMGMFFYLFLNLLIYQSRDNGLLLKLWGIKSCIFSLAGSYLGMRYSMKMCELSDCRDKSRFIRQELAQKSREEAGLRTAAYHDALTGVYNRQFAMDTIHKLLELHQPFVLCFVDLDRLKEVNDTYGHDEGDRYLLQSALELQNACRKEQDLLCRYGGDEFLLLFIGTPADIAEKRLRQANRRLQETAGSARIPFPMSLSWGVAVSSGRGDAEELVRAADARMYMSKRAKT